MVAPVLRQLLFGSAYCAEALALFAAMTVQPTPQRKRLYCNAITAIKNSGAWSILDGLYLIAAADAQSAKLNIKSPGTYDLSTVNSPAFTTDRGYVTDGASSYLDTTYDPTIAVGAKLTQNSGVLGYSSNSSSQISASFVGWFNVNGITNTGRSASDALTGRMSQVTIITTSNADGRGVFSVNRTGANAEALYKNGASAATDTIASTAVPSGTLKVGHAATASFAGAQVGSLFFGGALTADQEAAVYNAINAYLVAIGAN